MMLFLLVDSVHWGRVFLGVAIEFFFPFIFDFTIFFFIRKSFDFLRIKVDKLVKISRNATSSKDSAPVYNAAMCNVMMLHNTLQFQDVFH